MNLLAGIHQRLRHFPVEAYPRELDRTIRTGKSLAKPVPSVSIPENVLQLFFTQADQTTLWIEVRVNGVWLAVLHEEVSQRISAEVGKDTFAHVG